ncbi:hypothetical protein FB446DRAFT_774369 [Lentinula raphanica]|nr:hypothetical protein FB446DRAFT_774369 [Lentinula raphanica]
MADFTYIINNSVRTRLAHFLQADNSQNTLLRAVSHYICIIARAELTQSIVQACLRLSEGSVGLSSLRVSIAHIERTRCVWDNLSRTVLPNGLNAAARTKLEVGTKIVNGKRLLKQRIRRTDQVDHENLANCPGSSEVSLEDKNEIEEEHAFDGLGLIFSPDEMSSMSANGFHERVSNASRVFTSIPSWIQQYNSSAFAWTRQLKKVVAIPSGSPHLSKVVEDKGLQGRCPIDHTHCPGRLIVVHNPEVDGKRRRRREEQRRAGVVKRRRWREEKGKSEDGFHSAWIRTSLESTSSPESELKWNERGSGNTNKSSNEQVP